MAAEEAMDAPRCGKKFPFFLTKPMKKCTYWFIPSKPSASNIAVDAMIRIEIIGSGAGEAWAVEEAMADAQWLCQSLKIFWLKQHWFCSLIS